MLEKNHPRDPQERNAGGGGAPNPASSAIQRLDAEGLLAAGDEAIARALSGDSTAFLRAHRQAGGQ